MTNQNITSLNDKQKKQAGQIEQAKDISDETIFNINEENSALAAGGCGVCERKGFPIFLVRKTVISKNFDNQTWSTNVKSLGVRDPEVDLVSHEWAYRTLRKGFVYILVKRTKPTPEQSKNYQYLFYEVTPSGTLRHTTAKQPIEKNVREIPESCINDGHQYKGLFANIDTSIYGGVAYVAYSRRAWSRKTLKTYREAANAGDSEKLVRFSKIDISDASKKDPNQLSKDSPSRSLPFKDFESDTKLLEFDIKDSYSFENNDSGKMCLITKDKVVENLSLLKFLNTTNSSNSMSASRFIATWPNNQFSTTHPLNRLDYNKVKNEIKYKKSINEMSVLVLEDSMAIAEELAYHRKEKLQPLSQALIESEEMIQSAASEAYKKLLGDGSEADAFIDYDDIFNNAIESTPTEYHHWAQNIDGEKFDYFSEESIYLRKIMQYVDSYEMQMKSHIKESSEDLIVYKYSYYPGKTVKGYIVGKPDVYKDRHGNKVNPFDGTYNLTKIPTRPLTADELAMQQKEQDRIDKEENGDHTIKITVYPVKDAETVYQERVKKEWEEKYQVQLNLEKKNKALEKMKEDYEQVVRFVKKHSSDYFMYLTWLFGGKGRAKGVISKAQKQGADNLDILPSLTKYNEDEFWIREWDTNGSNNHIGYLCDFVNILDDCQIGNIKTNYQFTIWDLLMFDNKSLYYHIIHGVNGDLVTLKNDKVDDDTANVDEKVASKSWWDLLLQVRIEIDSFTPEQYEDLRKEYLANKIQVDVQNLSAEDKEKIERRCIALTKLINDHKSELNDLFFVEKGLVLLELFDVLVMRMNSALAQESENIYINQSILNLHLYQIGMILNGQPILRLKIEKVPVKNVPVLLELFYGVNNYKISDFASSEDNDKEVAVFVTAVAKSSHELYSKLKPILTFDSTVSNFTDFLGHVKTNLTTEATMGSLACEFNADKLDLTKIESFKNFREKTFEYSGIILSSISIYFAKQDIKKMESELNTFGLGQSKIVELRNKYIMAVTTYYASLINLVSSVLETGIKSLSHASFLRLSSLQIAKGAFAAIKLAGATAGIIGGAIGVIEGLITFQQALQKKEKGGQHATLYVVGAGLQLVSSALSIIGSLCIFAGFPPLGAILLLVAMAVGLATLVTLNFFKDESDDWNPMQNWLHRCAFGKQNPEHEDKGKPYPVTNEGMAFLCNDYVIARMGLNAVIQFNPEYYLTNKISRLPDSLKNTADLMYNSYRSYNEVDKRKYPTSESYQEAYVQEKMSNNMHTQAIYLVMQLAKEQVNQPNNYFEGTLGLDYQNEQVVIKFWKIMKNKKVNISLSISKSVTYFSERTTRELLMDDQDFDNKKILQVGKTEFVENRLDEKTGEYFGVNYKLGEGFTWGLKGYLRCKYWVNGKVDPNSGKTNIPILLHHKYNSNIS